MKPFDKPIYVTEPFLPPIADYSKGLEGIWERKWLTNNGPLEKQFESSLTELVKTENISLLNNGTMALQVGLRGLNLSGEVITTPFTFVATSNALIWNNLLPVFCDVEPDYFTIDPDKIEALITPQTSAILAVHVFGYPCKLKRLQEIADKYNIKLIYDAAHAFGVKIDGVPISAFGDLSMFSFHATKLMHSIEGGMLVFRDSSLKKKFDSCRCFGFDDALDVVEPGTNAKMTEFQALMGTLILPYMDEIIEKRKSVTDLYRKMLSEIKGLNFCPALPSSVNYNYSYAPVLIDEKEFGMSSEYFCEELKKFNIYTRRYFWPLVCDYTWYNKIPQKDPLTVSRRVADQVIMLPLYSSFDADIVKEICNIIKHLSNQGGR